MDVDTWIHGERDGVERTVSTLKCLSKDKRLTLTTNGRTYKDRESSRRLVYYTITMPDHAGAMTEEASHNAAVADLMDSVKRGNREHLSHIRPDHSHGRYS